VNVHTPSCPPGSWAIPDRAVCNTRRTDHAARRSRRGLCRPRKSRQPSRRASKKNNDNYLTKRDNQSIFSTTRSYDTRGAAGAWLIRETQRTREHTNPGHDRYDRGRPLRRRAVRSGVPVRPPPSAFCRSREKAACCFFHTSIMTVCLYSTTVRKANSELQKSASTFDDEDDL